MLLVRGWKGGLPALLLLALLSVVAARPAAAIGFDTTGLNIVDSFTLDQGSTGNPALDPVIVVGDVAYADWDVFMIMGFDSDLSQYTVSATADGIRITGPLDSPGWAGLDLGFVVHSISGNALATASLAVSADTSPLGIAGVSPESLLERGTHNEIGVLEAIIQDGSGIATDQTDISGAGLHSLLVRKKIFADFDEGIEEFATINYVDQGFTTVPEPATLALLALGLAGLARAGRR